MSQCLSDKSLVWYILGEMGFKFRFSVRKQASHTLWSQRYTVSGSIKSQTLTNLKSHLLRITFILSIYFGRVKKKHMILCLLFCLTADYRPSKLYTIPNFVSLTHVSQVDFLRCDWTILFSFIQLETHTQQILRRKFSHQVSTSLFVCLLQYAPNPIFACANEVIPAKPQMENLHALLVLDPWEGTTFAPETTLLKSSAPWVRLGQWTSAPSNFLLELPSVYRLLSHASRVLLQTSRTVPDL